MNGTISGGFTFGDITTESISNTNNISTGSLSVTGSIIGEDYCKIGDESTSTSGGTLRAGRINYFFPKNSPQTNQNQRGLELFWNAVADTRNTNDGTAGDSTLMNYSGGYSQGGGFSFQTTSGSGVVPTVLCRLCCLE